ncbi:MAG: ribosomal protein S18-alanine N-acetyltransferase [Myxococcota bacterium]
MIRDATAADLDALCELEARCFPGEPWTRGMLAEELGRPGGVVLVLEDERLLGMAIGWVVLDELHVLHVGVDPARRRGGLGRRLMDALEGAARGRAETGWLEVRRDNEPAIALYAALGWGPAGVRPRYYADGCDALLLRKRL